MSVGKQLLKKFAAIKKGEEATGILDFLGNYKKLAGTTPVLETNDLKDPRKILLAIETALVRACIRADAVLEEKKGDTDYIGADLVTLSKLLAHFFLLKAFLDKIDASKDKKDLLPLLDLLAQLYGAVVVLEGFSGTFLTFSVVSTDAMAKNSTEHIADLCAELRPHVIPLTDSFMMSDMMINAPIGYYNGDIYENYFRVVNQNNPPKNTKAPYSSELEAMLGRSSLAERQRFEREDETEEILSG